MGWGGPASLENGGLGQPEQGSEDARALHSEQTVVSALLFTLFAGSLAARWERLWGTPKGVFVCALGAHCSTVCWSSPATALFCSSAAHCSLGGGRGCRAGWQEGLVQVLPGGDSHLARMS